MNLKEIQFWDLFSGYGLISHSYWEIFWTTPQFAVEKNKNAKDAHHKLTWCANFICKNVEDLNWNDLPNVNVLHMSPPCPVFSSLNQNKHKITHIENDQHNLILEWFRIVSEMKSPPLVITVENVPDYLKTEILDDWHMPIKRSWNLLFKNSHLPKICKLLSRWWEYKWKCTWKIMDADKYWAPTKRSRAFIVFYQEKLWNFKIPDWNLKWMTRAELMKSAWVTQKDLEPYELKDINWDIVDLHGVHKRKSLRSMESLKNWLYGLDKPLWTITTGEWKWLQLIEINWKFFKLPPKLIVAAMLDSKEETFKSFEWQSRSKILLACGNWVSSYPAKALALSIKELIQNYENSSN